MQLDLDEAPRTRLPPGMKPLQVFGDFLRYMLSCVQKDICDRFIDGKELWSSLNESARYVLTHPNGWEGPQQAQMRKAAIIGGLVPDTPTDRERFEFVSEGEASFHWCVDTDVATAALVVGNHIVIADAGGGTIDVSSYRVTSVQPLLLQETASPTCKLAGSVFVTQRFKVAMQKRLEQSRFGDEDHIDELVEEFDQTTKCIFRGTEKPTYIKMRSRKYNDLRFGIRAGQLVIPSNVISQTFEPSCLAVTKAIREHISPKGNSHVFLTGGFGSNPWLYSELKRRLADAVIDVSNGDSNCGKAVAHGAIAFYLDHHVNARVARHTLGVSLRFDFNERNELHRARRAEAFICPIAGELLLGGGFKTIVRKGDILTSDAKFTTGIERTIKDSSGKVSLNTKLERYTGSKQNIEFKDMDDASHFGTVCTFIGEAGSTALEQREGPCGAFASMAYTTTISLGGTELKCQVEWLEKGKIKRGPVVSVWEDI